jgi:integrase
MILTPEIQSDRFPDSGGDLSMSMKGGIYTKEKCPFGCKYEHSEKALICPIHQTRPRHVYIAIWSKRLHKLVTINTDEDNNALSWEKAERILTTLRDEIDRKKGADFDPSRYVSTHIKPYRLSNYAKHWLERKTIEVEKKRRAPSYLKALKVYALKWEKFWGDLDIRNIGNSEIKDFYLWLDGSPKYVKNIMDALKTMLTEAYREKKIQEIPAFPKVELRDSDIKIIDLETQDKIIRTIQDHMDRGFLLFTAREMVRPSETRALFWEDLDFKFDRVTIRRHFSLNELREATKSKNIKILPLDGEVRQSLLALPRHITSPFVFWKGKQGRPFSESWARKLWKRVSLRMGIDISLYQGTRHSSATEAADRVGIDAVQEFLAHTNRKMTQRYAQKNPERLRKVLRK